MQNIMKRIPTGLLPALLLLPAAAAAVGAAPPPSAKAAPAVPPLSAVTTSKIKDLTAVLRVVEADFEALGKIDKNITYLQSSFVPGRHLEQVRRMEQLLAPEVQMHCEFLRTMDGQVTCTALQIVKFSTEERLQEIMQIYRDNGVRIVTVRGRFGDIVTRTRILRPWSAVARTYAWLVAPPIAAQSVPSGLPPEVGQRTH